jgi:hypothetical protein
LTEIVNSGRKIAAHPRQVVAQRLETVTHSLKNGSHRAVCAIPCAKAATHGATGMAKASSLPVQ